MQKTISVAMLTLLLVSMLTFVFNSQVTKASTALSFASKSLSVDWTHYHNYTEIVDILLSLNATYPSVVDVFPIGRSWQNRTIYCVRLTNENDTYSKPKVMFVGYHHARERISAELPLYFVVYAAENYGVNTTVTRMLDLSDIYVIVALNVDGFAAVEANEWQRKNVHPFDEDGDGLLDEDPPDDEDGDGYIEDLIQWNGVYWEFVRWEGVDDDADSLLNEDWVGGVDLNRNYGYKWDASVQSGSPYPQDEDYRGPSPFSELETQALRDLALQHNFEYAISFHSGADVVLYPWGYTTSPAPDDQKFQEMASDMAALVGSPYQQSGYMYTTSGVWDDWMYGNRSVFAFTCEIYKNSSAWQYEPGPLQDSWWEKGIFQYFNPAPRDIETVAQRWLPIFTYIADRAITEGYADVAIPHTVVEKAVVGQGFSVEINVTVANQGNSSETFSITVYANATLIALQNVTLSRGNSTTVAFVWNTTGWVKGNYTISVVADIVPGEVDVGNNVLAGGWVFVTIAGDVDGDRDVDIFDIVRMAGVYGMSKLDPRYDSNCDIDGDGDVDIFDIVAAAGNYGESW